MKLGSPDALRHEPSNHAWEEQEAKRDAAIEKAEDMKEELELTKRILIETENPWIIKFLMQTEHVQSPRELIHDAILNARYDIYAANSKTKEIMDKWFRVTQEREERSWWAASACCGATLSDETNICSACHDYSLSRSAEADMQQAKKEYDAATPAERAKVLDKEDEDECPHDELDHGICMDCGKDCFDDLVAAAEFNAECREDR